MTRVADTLARALAAHGIRQAFGMPGGEVVTLVDALGRAGIAFHLCRHETAGAMMAAAVSTLAGVPGLLVTTLGPGLANAVDGIADAAQERVPLVVITGIVDRPTRALYTHQVVDHAAMLRPVVKASFEIEPGAAARTLARAVALAMTAPMGPVHLELAPGVAASEDRPEPVVPVTRRVAPEPAGPVLDELAGLIAASERPVILAGFEAARCGAGPGVLALARRCGAPVITTYKGKGLVPETDPCSLGGAGLSPAADAILLDLVRRADLVLLIGYDPIEMRPGWLDPASPGVPVVEITRLPADHGMHVAHLSVDADPAATLEALLPRLEGQPGWVDASPARTRAALEARFAGSGAFGPHAVIRAVSAAAGPQAIVTVDSGAHRILLSQLHRTARPLALLQSAGFCTMAAALPLAIGAKLAEPARRVIATLGDGGLEMGLGELATLRDLGLPVTVVVFQDRSLALIALKQQQAGLAPAGVALGETDFAAIARAFGGHGETVTTSEALEAALAAAAGRPGFSLIACRFDADAYQNAF